MTATTQGLTRIAEDLLQRTTSDLMQYSKEQKENLPEDVSYNFEVAFSPAEQLVATQDAEPLNEGTIETARILFYFWHSRRYNTRLAKGDDVAIMLEEIIQHKTAKGYHEDGKTGNDLGDQRERIVADLQLLQHYAVNGQSTLTLRGQPQKITFHDPYLNSKAVTRKTSDNDKHIIGFLVSPGPWLFQYEEDFRQAIHNTNA